MIARTLVSGVYTIRHELTMCYEMNACDGCSRCALRFERPSCGTYLRYGGRARARRYADTGQRGLVEKVDDVFVLMRHRTDPTKVSGR